VLERSVYSPRVRSTGVTPHEPLLRPPFGAAPGAERRTPAPPPRFEGSKPPRVEAPKAPKLPKTPKPGKLEKLPGEPANRVYKGRPAPVQAPAPAPATPGIR
jgi:hypothetical protein